MLRLTSVFCVSYETDDCEAEEREENESVDVGGDCGSNDAGTDSTLAVAGAVYLTARSSLEKG